ncbi:unnamed protein product [Rangifer tarandus platyrhynchus]|uniref:Uncharacterized protein n=1 Tax=Rangifer tarandus platyrhynchus TaxID=3082113 RepID=A0AC60A9H3_RANTA
MSFQGVGVVRVEIKTGTGSSPSWRFLSALTCGRGLEPSSRRGRRPRAEISIIDQCRMDQTGKKPLWLETVFIGRNNIPKGGTCKSGIEPGKSLGEPLIIPK